MSLTAEDARHMARALELAARGLYTTDPNPRVGCVIVRDGAVQGEGWHQRAGEPHAEIHALKAAGQNARGATVYLTLEPCCHHGRTPPCSRALIEAGVRRVVAAMLDPNPLVSGKGYAELEAAGIEVTNGLMTAEAEALNPGFAMRMRAGRPLVRVKLAASLDGRTAMADGTSRWITGPDARADVQRWRARSSAILTGVATVVHDDPALTVRDLDIGRQPLRIVLDSRLRIPPQAQMLRLPGRTLVVTALEDKGRLDALRAAGAEVLILPTRQDRIDIAALLTELAARHVNEVLVEAGATLAGGLVEAGVVDELIVYVAPHLMGSHERPLLNLPPLAGMGDRIELEIADVRAIGKDWRVVAKVSPRGR